MSMMCPEVASYGDDWGGNPGWPMDGCAIIIAACGCPGNNIAFEWTGDLKVAGLYPDIPIPGASTVPCMPFVRWTKKRGEAKEGEGSKEGTKEEPRKGKRGKQGKDKRKQPNVNERITEINASKSKLCLDIFQKTQNNNVSFVTVKGKNSCKTQQIQ